MPSLSLIFIPVVGAAIGALISVAYRPGPTLVSAIQHFAAGVVFAAAAGEILPGLKHQSIYPVLIGGGLGVITMLTIKRLEAGSRGPVSLLSTVGIDIFVDGLVLGLGFLAGQREGLLLTIALTIEIVFLGLTVTAELDQGSAPRVRIIATTIGLSLLLPVGTFVATPISWLPSPAITGFFAFGLIALLYLVTEELLVEAHAQPDRPWVTAMFFAGFLLLLVLEQAIT